MVVFRAYAKGEITHDISVYPQIEELGRTMFAEERRH
jgi:hypothetical protein